LALGIIGRILLCCRIYDISGSSDDKSDESDESESADSDNRKVAKALTGRLATTVDICYF